MWSGHRLGQLTTVSEKKNIIFVLLSFISTLINIELISLHKDDLGIEVTYWAVVSEDIIFVCLILFIKLETKDRDICKEVTN